MVAVAAASGGVVVQPFRLSVAPVTAGECALGTSMIRLFGTFNCSSSLQTLDTRVQDQRCMVSSFDCDSAVLTVVKSAIGDGHHTQASQSLVLILGICTQPEMSSQEMSAISDMSEDCFVDTCLPFYKI